MVRLMGKKQVCAAFIKLCWSENSFPHFNRIFTRKRRKLIYDQHFIGDVNTRPLITGKRHSLNEKKSSTISKIFIFLITTVQRLLKQGPYLYMWTILSTFAIGTWREREREDNVETIPKISKNLVACITVCY